MGNRISFGDEAFRGINVATVGIENVHMVSPSVSRGV